MSTPVSKTDSAIPQTHADRIVDPRTYGQPELLHESLTWLRANQPLGKLHHPEFTPFWLVTKYADILEISRQNDKFHSGDQSTVLAAKAVLDNIERMSGSPHLIRNLVTMDPPEHMKYRGITQTWFMPNRIRALETRIREIARKFIDGMAEKDGQCDFVKDVALHYPLHVVMEILGVPEADEPLMLKLTQELFGSRDPELGRSAAEMADPAAAVRVLQAVFADITKYFNAIAEDRRKNPKDDVATVVANALVDGQPIKPFETASYYTILATAGHDTTSASTAGAIWALCEFPDEFAKLKADPSLISSLVDEAIRWTTPVKHFMRSAVCDYELRGQQIKAGDWIMLSYLSGNRDEEIFSEPFQFRADRTPNRHVAFGHGPHLCLGQHLAKLEMRILFEELLPRLQTLEFAGTPKMVQSNFVGGPKTLPIRYKLA